MCTEENSSGSGDGGRRAGVSAGSGSTEEGVENWGKEDRISLSVLLEARSSLKTGKQGGPDGVVAELLLALPWEAIRSVHKAFERRLQRGASAVLPPGCDDEVEKTDLLGRDDRGAYAKER